MVYSTEEIDKLAQMLKDAHINHRLLSLPSLFIDERKKILLYFGENDVHTGITTFEILTADGRVCSVINSGYGSEEGLLEISCVGSMMTDIERADGKDVIGYLTAEDVFERIKKDWEKTTVEIEEGVLIKYRICTDHHVVLPEGITEIGPEACTTGYFTSIEIPRGVRKIGDRAFAGHWDLQEIMIPPSVVEIGNDILEGADDEYIEIHTAPGSYAAEWSKTAIGWSYIDMDKDIEYRIENHIAFIEPGAEIVPARAFFPYSDAAMIREIVIPEGVTEIREEAFADCCMLERIVYPSTIKTIDHLFIHPEATIRELVIPYGVEEIAEDAFLMYGDDEGKMELDTLHIPGSVKVIRSAAFNDCSIHSLTLDEGIETIDPLAFASNPLNEVVLPSSAVNVDEIAFTGEDWQPVKLIRKTK